MFGWFKDKQVKNLEEKTQQGFSHVKKDIESVGKWIKHLDAQDKQLFDIIFTLREELSTIREDIDSLREGLEIISENEKNKQVFKKLPVLGKQTGVQDVEEVNQTGVQTGDFNVILQKLSANERLLIFTLLNSDMKLSYEDLALLLGKERATIRGQVNSIKQKSVGFLEEISEKNGKKRVFIPEKIKEKMRKYAKVRVGRGKKGEKNEE